MHKLIDIVNRLLQWLTVLIWVALVGSMFVR